MTPFRSVVAYAPQGLSVFGLGLVAKVFADRTRVGMPAFHLSLCTEFPGEVRTDSGLTVQIRYGLGRLDSADLVLLLPGDDRTPETSPAAVAAVRAAHDRGAIVASFCYGSYLLADTGLLDGRLAATHWSLAADFAARYPAVRVAPESLYVDEGRIVTGAGAVSGIDMCLHLLRREHGSAVANAIARELVIAPHRSGGQIQRTEAPMPEGDDERLMDLLSWMRANLHLPLPVGELAARAMMSPRTFARRFKAVTGTTPHAWLLAQRMDRAEELLEITALPLEEVARRVGYGSAGMLREHFVKRRGVSPSTYRRSVTRARPDALGSGDDACRTLCPTA